LRLKVLKKLKQPAQTQNLLVLIKKFTGRWNTNCTLPLL